MITIDPAGPTAIDHESAPWWDGLRRHQLVLQRCEACGRVRSPRMPSCPYCGRDGGADVVVSGRGHIYSWVRVHRDLGTTPRPLPIVVATVELAEDCRVFARVVDGDDDVAIGRSVESRFVDHDGWTELCVAVVPDGSGAR